MSLPDGLISYGPDANCTLSLCPLEASVLAYRPILGLNAAWIALFGVCMVIQVAEGVRWRSIWFTTCMVLGCVGEMVGYAGRVLLYQNPFSFPGFLIQIVCITVAPVFFSAAIYILLAKIVVYLNPEYSRFQPKYFYYIFIVCDIISLVLQASGGAMSSTSSGGSTVAVDISIAGLSFQVITLVVFIALAIDYAIRWRNGAKGDIEGASKITKGFNIFVAFLSLSTILILIRCAYRIAELKDGYRAEHSLIQDEPTFIALESVMMLLAAFALCIGHPGPIFYGRNSHALRSYYLEKPKPSHGSSPNSSAASAA